MARVMAAPHEDLDIMFVQTAMGISSGQGTLTLHGINPSTLYVSRRPEQTVGHVDTVRFIELWGEGRNDFVDDPPNAVLSFSGPPGDLPQDVVVILGSPILDGRTLQYSIEIIEGNLPLTGGSCVLFIDPFGRPQPLCQTTGLVRRHTERRIRRR